MNVSKDRLSGIAIGISLATIFLNVVMFLARVLS